MSKFCANCGAENTDDAVFCVGCGSQVGAAAQAQNVASDANNAAGEVNNVYNQAAPAAKKKIDKKYFIIGGVAVAVIAVLVVLLSLIFGSNYKTPLSKFEKIYEKGDGDSLQTVSMSSKQLKAIKKSDLFENKYDGDFLFENKYDGDFDEYFDDAAEDIYKSIKEQYGDDVEFDYKVKDKTKMDKDDLKDYQSELENWAKKYDVEYEPKVSKGYELKVRVVLEGDDDFNGSIQTIKVYKVDGDWVTPYNLY